MTILAILISAIIGCAVYTLHKRTSEYLFIRRMRKYNARMYAYKQGVAALPSVPHV